MRERGDSGGPEAGGIARGRRPRPPSQSRHGEYHHARPPHDHRPDHRRRSPLARSDRLLGQRQRHGHQGRRQGQRHAALRAADARGRHRHRCGASGAAVDGTAARPAAENGRNSGSGTGGTRVEHGQVRRSGPACGAADVRVTEADETPTAHIVLTAKNTSGHACRLYQYPLIAFGDIHTAKDVPAVAKSNPGTPVVLQPGDPAYANVRVALGGAHEDTKAVGRFNVNLFAADGPAEGSVVVSAPAGGLAVDEAAARTGYWTYELRNGADEFLVGTSVRRASSRGGPMSPTVPRRSACDVAQSVAGRWPVNGWGPVRSSRPT
ncbi:DUF4232 domain-containing protein [Streptomyces lasalocidi]